MIPYNPVDRADLPKRKKYKGKAYSVDTAFELVDKIKGDVLEPAVILGLYYGLRRSEVLGLRWSDIDYKSGTIHIQNTVVRYTTTVECEQTKSDTSNRTLYIIPETKDYFLDLRKRQQEAKLLLGSSYYDNDHVCRHNDGTPFKPNYISKRFSDLLKKYDLPHIRFHDLRHTAGSLLLDSKMSIKQIQEYLGHDQVSTTLDIYAHLSLEGKKEPAMMMGKILSRSTA